MVSAAAALVPLVQTVTMALTSTSSSPPPSAEGSSGGVGVGRTFHYVPYGSKTFDPSVSFPNRPWITCDGRVEAASASTTADSTSKESSTIKESLELSHWNGNTTPDIYYADTSTEMALNLPLDVYENAVVVNNHYDSDGVLSVFGCLQPQMAQQHAALIISAAEAGDFGEWTTNGGVVLNGCLEWYGSHNNEEVAYQRALHDLPQLLHEIDRPMTQSDDDTLTSSALSTDNLELTKVLQAGQAALDEAQRDYACLLDGTTFLVKQGPGCIVLVEEPPLQRLSPYALHKYLTNMNWWSNCNRLLRYSIVSTSQVDASILDKINDNGNQDAENEFESFSTYSYVYEKPGHGWVHKLRDRRPIPVINVHELVDKLNTIYDGEWQTGGPSGLVALCRTKTMSNQEGLDDSPDEVAALLLDLDVGAR